MIAAADHDPCKCGHIRADHRAEHFKLLAFDGKCLAFDKNQNGLSDPCDCESFTHPEPTAAQVSGSDVKP